RRSRGGSAKARIGIPRTKLLGRHGAENGRKLGSHRPKLVSLAEDHVSVVEDPAQQGLALGLKIQDAWDVQRKMRDYSIHDAIDGSSRHAIEREHDDATPAGTVDLPQHVRGRL